MQITITIWQDLDFNRNITYLNTQRGKTLRFIRPLRLAGKTIQMVAVYSFDTAGEDSTKLTVSVRAAGKMQEGPDKIAESVWRHSF